MGNKFKKNIPKIWIKQKHTVSLYRNMKKIRIIAVTYAHTTELEVFIGSLLLQTCRDWTLEVWHDGEPPVDVEAIMQRYESDERVVLRRPM